MRVSDLCGLGTALRSIGERNLSRCGVCSRPMGPNEGLECLECTATCSRPIGGQHALKTQQVWERAEDCDE